MTTRVVDQSGGGDSTTINGAVALASSGDVIRILRGEYQEQVSDSGKDLRFEGEGLVLIQGSGSLATGFALINSIVAGVVVQDFTTAGIDGGIVFDCHVKDSAIGIKDAVEALGCLLEGNVAGTDGTVRVGNCTVANGSEGLKEAEEIENVVFADIIDCLVYAVDTSAVKSAKRMAFDSTITNYENIATTPETTLAGFKVTFGNESGEDVTASFMDKANGFYGLETDEQTLFEFDSNYRPAGQGRSFVGTSPNINSSLMRLGVFAGPSFDGTKVAGVGTFSTGVFDLAEAREILQVLLVTSENITGGDKIEKTSGILDIEYRGSTIPFAKDDGSPAYMTVERRKKPTGTFRFWQFRITVAGTAELFAVAVALARSFGDATVPTWTGSEGVDSISIDVRGGINVTLFDRVNADDRWRLYMKRDTAIDLFADVNIVCESDIQTIVLHQEPDGSALQNATYFFGARLVSRFGREELNVENESIVFAPVFPIPSIPDISGKNLGDGGIEITLVDGPDTEPIYLETEILRQRLEGFTQRVGSLVNDGEKLTIEGFIPGTVETFIGVAVGTNGRRSNPSEEVRIVVAGAEETEAERENIYT